MLGEIFRRRNDTRSLLSQKLQFCKRLLYNLPFLSDSSWCHVRKHSSDRIIIYGVHLHGVSINFSYFSMHPFAAAISLAGSFSESFEIVWQRRRRKIHGQSEIRSAAKVNSLRKWSRIRIKRHGSPVFLFLVICCMKELILLWVSRDFARTNYGKEERII